MIAKRLNNRFYEYAKFRNTHMSDSCYYDLIKSISKKINHNQSIITFSPGVEQNTVESWNVETNIFNKVKFGAIPNHHLSFKYRFLNGLHENKTVSLVLRIYTNQIYHKENSRIQELWGYVFVCHGNNRTTMEQLKCDELYAACTINLRSGKKNLPESNVVYCGEDGKICGWDMI